MRARRRFTLSAPSASTRGTSSAARRSRHVAPRQSPSHKGTDQLRGVPVLPRHELLYPERHVFAYIQAAFAIGREEMEAPDRSRRDAHGPPGGTGAQLPGESLVFHDLLGVTVIDPGVPAIRRQSDTVGSDDVGPLVQELTVEIEDVDPGIDAVDDVHPVSVRVDDDPVNPVPVQSLSHDTKLARSVAGLPKCRHELPVLGKPYHPVTAGGPQIAIRGKSEKLDHEVPVLGL